MLPKLTPNELRARARSYIASADAIENPNWSVGIRVEVLAETRGNHPALLFKDKSWNWGEFNKESNVYANLFRKLGLKEGDTVGIILENSPEYLFVTTGINKVQGVCALVNVKQRKQALIHAINIVEPKWIVLDGQSLSFFSEVVSSLNISNQDIFVINNPSNIQHDYREMETLLKNISVSNPPTTFKSDLTTLAQMIYTSGTTGLPKAVVWTNVGVFGSGSFWGYSVSQVDENDVFYSVTPLYHSLAHGLVWGSVLYAGAAIVIRDRFSTSNFWRDIRKYKVTVTSYIGEIPRYLMNNPPNANDKSHTLKKMIGLGLKEKIWIDFKERFGIDHIFELYSSTEGFGPLVNVDEVPGMVGRDNLETHGLAKVDPDTGDFIKNKNGYCVRCKPGDIGMSLFMIEQEGRDNFIKYKNEENTKKRIIENVFEDGDMYFITGDYLQLHEDRWVTFADRSGDTFRWKGENVSTLEVENILNSHESIFTSAVYGVEIPNNEGRAGMASICSKSTNGLDLNSISKFVEDSLPRYSIPVFIRECKKMLETTGTYKITKTSLKREGYNLSAIKDSIYYWDSKTGSYLPFTEQKFHDLKDQKLNF